MAKEERLSGPANDLEQELAKALSYEQFRKWRPSWTRKLRREMEYLVYLGGLWLAERCSLERLQFLGGMLGQFVHVLLYKERGIVLFQLEQVFPELSPEERRVWCRECFGHFGQLLMEFLGMQRIDEIWPDCCEIENEELLRQALKRGKGVLLMALHQGNWELISLYAKHAGITMHAATTNVPEARINERMLKRRENQYMRIIRRGESGAVRKLLNCLKHQQVLVLANDQDTNVPSNWVPFFGIPAKTPVGLATMALKTGAPILSYVILRQDGGRFKLIFDSVGSFGPNAAGPGEVYSLNKELNRHLEFMIRREPKQWAWFHRRWRHRPGPEEFRQIKQLEQSSGPTHPISKAG